MEEKLSEEQEDMKLNYLAEILVEAYLDERVANDSSFIDPRINKPIYDLIRDSKERGKKKK